MTRNQIILRPPPLNRRQPLLSTSSQKSTNNARLAAEVAGGTAAECAAVCCCCPCGLINLLILVLCKLPAGLCKRVLRRRRRKKLIKKGLLPSTTTVSNRMNFCGCDETETYVHPTENESEWIVKGEEKDLGCNGSGFGGGIEDGLMELEKQMLKEFYSSGFWRSPSSTESEMDKMTAITCY